MQNQSQNSSAALKPRLLDQLRNKCRVLHYSIRIETAYVDCATRFLRFHRRPDGTWRAPAGLVGPEIGRFLTHLALQGKVAASTQDQASWAIVFLYRQVLEMEHGNTVLSVNEVRLILQQYAEESLPRLMLELFYGTGMRLMEVGRPRIKDEVSA